MPFLGQHLFGSEIEKQLEKEFADNDASSAFWHGTLVPLFHHDDVHYYDGSKSILQTRNTMKKSLCLLAAFLHGEYGYGASFVFTSQNYFKSTSSHHGRTSSKLQDSLFDDIFESEPLPPKNYNEDAAPFSELESDQDRARRMEMVRELQKVYYKEPNSASSSPSAATPSSSTQSTTLSDTLSYGHTTLRNLPTITSHDGIQTADNAALLPGYQFVWNIHNPQHCHMFHSILSGPAPWYFAHVFLPGPSSSSSSATAAVVAESSTTEDDTTPTVINNMESYNDIQSELKSPQGLYGTLLRITDRRFHDEDGRIVLAVQALEKIRIHNVSSKLGTSPYLCTDVQVAPEDELTRMYFDKALMSSASFLSSHDDASIGGENDENDDHYNPLSSPSAVSGAARAAAVADSIRCRTFECLPIFLEEKPKRANNIDEALEAKSTDSNATKKVKETLRKQEKENAEAYISVVQLMNYDSFAHGSLDDAESVTTQSLETYWKNLAREIKTAQTPSAEEDLFSENEDSSSSSLFLPEPPSSSNSSPTPFSTSVEAVEMMEYHLWRSLDNMIRLLSMASAATVPLPSQLLGLLPKRDDWPQGFVLEGAATSLEQSGSNIGTSFKSPFVRVDQITATSSKYFPLRRAQRLSYVIWLLLDGLSITGSDSPPPSRSDVLRMTSVLARLEAAKRTIDGVNEILKQLIPKKE